MRLRRILTIPTAAIVLFVGSIPRAEALPPRMVLGGWLGGVNYGFDGEATDSYSQFRGEWQLGWREALENGGYAAVSALAGLTYLGEPIAELQDVQFVSGELAMPAGSNRLLLDLSSRSSINYVGSVDSFWEPDWGVTYRLLRGRRAPEPFLGYRGGYRLEAGGTGDRIETFGIVGVEYDPSVRLGTLVELQSGVEHWFERRLVDDKGALTDESRRDYVSELSLSLDGLLGYLVDWRFQLSGAYRESNADRYLDATGVREPDSEDRFESGVSAELRWTPVRQFGLRAAGSLTTDHYQSRRVLDESGEPRDSTLRYSTLSTSLTADWTPDDRFFLVFRTILDREFSNQPGLDSWSITTEVGAEIALQ